MDVKIIELTAYLGKYIIYSVCMLYYSIHRLYIDCSVYIRDEIIIYVCCQGTINNRHCFIIIIILGRPVTGVENH